MGKSHIFANLSAKSQIFSQKDLHLYAKLQIKSNPQSQISVWLSAKPLLMAICLSEKQTKFQKLTKN